MLGSCDVPFWEYAKMSALFDGGIDLELQGEAALSPDDIGGSGLLFLEVVDIAAHLDGGFGELRSDRR